MSEAIRILRDAPLRARNTFGVEATARCLVEVADAGALPDALSLPELHGTAPLVLGGGSNLLIAADPPQPLLALTGARVRLVSDEGGSAIVRAEAGANWHAFVMRTLDQGLCGLENLALIPGTVGAAPIQNIGAYGVEVRERIHAVEAWDRERGALRRLSADDCAFAYRDSRFKREPERWIVTAVEFALSRRDEPRLDYAGIAEELHARGIARPCARDVAEAVIAIRRRKLPDPAVLGNAGSFFKNPIVPAAQAEALRAMHPALPVFRGDGAHSRKLSAAWLIDACGWKGHREGDAGVAPTHALVLVNHGGATGAQLLSLARRIAASVHERFGVVLEPEPRVIGASWP
jgi:UDP-N-acetylmuramate dehydrogenase